MTKMNLNWPGVAALLACASTLLAESPPAGADVARQLDRAFADVAAKVTPSVVVINVVQTPDTAPQSDSDDDGFDALPPGFWRHFHEQFKRDRPELTRSQGSGVIMRPNGFILTNRHVVEDAESIEVRLKDGRTFKGRIQGVDPQSDIAVLKIDAQNLPTCSFADSARVRVGQFAIAIGAPYSLDYTVTFGHVSAKGRSNIIDTDEGASMDQDFIQTDALINPGNSGGPLVNIDGQVIGINTLIRGLHTGIGFAVPSNLAREVAEQLIAHGKFTRPWLGVGTRALRDLPDLQQVLKGTSDGVVVSLIIPDSPAAKSDLKPTDVITAVDGSKVSTPQELRAVIREKKIGQPLTLDVVRLGKGLKVKLSPGEAPDSQPALAQSSPPQPRRASSNLGIVVQPLTPELAARFGLAATPGVLVASVEKESPAARHGLQPGDVITSIDQQEVRNPKEFRELVKKTDLDKGVLLNLVSHKIARFELLKREAP
jgi:serine protease Do